MAENDAICPHGDKTCPCPDGLACHYEGEDPMRCPNALRVEELEAEVERLKLNVTRRVGYLKERAQLADELAAALRTIDRYGDGLAASNWGGLAQTAANALVRYDALTTEASNG